MKNFTPARKAYKPILALLLLSAHTFVFAQVLPVKENLPNTHTTAAPQRQNVQRTTAVRPAFKNVTVANRPPANKPSLGNTSPVFKTPAYKVPSIQRAPGNRPYIGNRPPVPVAANRPTDENQSQAYRSPEQAFRSNGGNHYRPHYTHAPVIWQGRRYYSQYAYAYHPYQPHYYGSYFHPIGFFAATLEFGAISIELNDEYYRYYQGVYYAPYDNGYRVVPAPAGAFVRNLPDGYTTVSLDNYNFYYFAGTFYTATDGGYSVITAPPGAVVYDLPDGCTELKMGNITYLQYNDTVFQPIVIDGNNAYEVVDLESGN